MAATQLSFSLRTSANCKTVHLCGSWDNYKSSIPLSKDSSKAGAWKGNFRFSQTTLKPGSRVYYFYYLDSYQVSHDPSKTFTTEPTTGRKLNVLDVPAAGRTAAAPAPSSKRHSRHTPSDIPKGRCVSPSQIKSPKPIKPNQTRKIVTEAYAAPTVEALTSRFSQTTVDDSDSDYDSSDDESDVPSLTSRSSGSSSPSSVSSTSSCCTCERYGITRAGDRVKLDCGGSRCGSDSDSCSSDSDEEYRARSTRRQGIVVRG